MTKQSRHKYTEEFKREAVKLVEEQGRATAEVARIRCTAVRLSAGGIN